MTTVKTTVIKLMNCGFASEGILRIDNIASGVGVIMFDVASRQAAGIHILRGEAPAIAPKNPAYYADTGIAFIFEHFKKQSPNLRISIAMAGGASLLAISKNKEIGSKVVTVAKDTLAKFRLQVKLEKIGGSKARSMVLNIDEGKIKII